MSSPALTADSFRYDTEQQTVWTVRLVVHLMACIMMYAGRSTAAHPFLASNRRFMLASFLLSAATACIELLLPHTSSYFYIEHVLYKSMEACVAWMTLSGAYLVYGLLHHSASANSTFYAAVAVGPLTSEALKVWYALAVITNNVVKIGYLANAIVSVSSCYIFYQFYKALESPSLAPMIISLVAMEALLTTLNAVVFVLSFGSSVWGLKVAVYVIYLFRILLLHFFIMPHLQARAPYDALRLSDKEHKEEDNTGDTGV